MITTVEVWVLGGDDGWRRLDAVEVQQDNRDDQYILLYILVCYILHIVYYI